MITHLLTSYVLLSLNYIYKYLFVALIWMLFRKSFIINLSSTPVMKSHSPIACRDDRTRTYDPLVPNQVFYQLNYISKDNSYLGFVLLASSTFAHFRRELRLPTQFLLSLLHKPSPSTIQLNTLEIMLNSSLML